MSHFEDARRNMRLDRKLAVSVFLSLFRFIRACDRLLSRDPVGQQLRIESPTIPMTP
jgi:hypothetical protein